MQPLISVIIPCYNVEKYLAESLESVLNQDYRNLEILVVDDHSSDSSFSIATDLSDKDGRIKILRNLGKGVASARNTGLDNATGQFIAFVDGCCCIECVVFALDELVAEEEAGRVAPIV